LSLVDIASWTKDEVIQWASKIPNFEDPAQIMKKQNMTGEALLATTVHELRSLGFSFGSTIALINAIEATKAKQHAAAAAAIPTYHLIPIEDSLRVKLKDSDNCLLYKLQEQGHLYVHVGVKRVVSEIEDFISQPPDATQRKNLIYVVGTPKV
jgi:hypothetical protein